MTETGPMSVQPRDDQTDRCAYCLRVFEVRDGIGDALARWCSPECRQVDLNEADPAWGGHSSRALSGFARGPELHR